MTSYAAPRSVSSPKPRGHCLTPATSAARRLWLTRRDASTHLQTGLQAEQHRALQEQHKQAVKQARKDKTARFLNEIDQAIARGDQHVAYQTLKLLRPWKPALNANQNGLPKHGRLRVPSTEQS